MGVKNLFLLLPRKKNKKQKQNKTKQNQTKQNKRKKKKTVKRLKKETRQSFLVTYLLSISYR